MSKNILKPKKCFGQNFLTNPRVKNRIIDSCDLKSTDIILEIGPGDGRLTRLIAPKVKKVIAVEIDTNLYKNFLVPEFKNSNVEVWNEDILNFPFDKLPNQVKIIGNLPYNISTPILEKALNFYQKFHSFYMTVQLEFGQRLVANPDSKKYGSLSCFVQYQAQSKLLFKISRNSFYPAPKVESCFISLHFPETPLYQITNKEIFLKIIHKAFEQRRKTITNSLSSFAQKKDIILLFESLNINPKFRAENLSIENFVDIANNLCK